jgi:four helix bundle protein
MMIAQKEKFKVQNDSEKAKGELKKRSYHFAVAVVKYMNTLKTNNVSAPLVNQLIRSATSVGANVMEAQAASSKRDFTKYFEIALKSANETKFWLCVMRDGLEIEDGRINELLDEAIQLSKILGSSILTLKNKRA